MLKRLRRFASGGNRRLPQQPPLSPAKSSPNLANLDEAETNAAMVSCPCPIAGWR